MVFGRFFGAKKHAKSDLKKSVREPFRIGPANTKSMSALLRQRLFRAKITQKLHVFWDIDFKGILGRFWEGFGSQNPQFSQFFREKTEAKNKKKFGRVKNRILRPQKQIADPARRYVRVRGKEQKDGGSPLS